MSESQQVRKNLLFNVINFLVNLFIGVVYTPYLVTNLGVIAYGIIPLALIISQYISIFSSSLTSTLTRYYSVAYQKDDFIKAAQYLTSSFAIIVALIVIVVAITIGFVFNLEILLNIPNELIKTSKYLFLYTLISFSISLVSSYLNITLYARNRLDYMNTINLSRSVSRVLSVIVFFEFVNVSLVYVGLASLISEIVVLLLSFFYFLRTNDSRVKIHSQYFNKKSLVPILIMTIWVIIHQIGDMGIYKIDIIFLNKYWSTKESGILGAFSDLGSYIMVLTGLVTSLFGPIILIAFSKNEHERIKKIVIDNSFIICLAAVLMAGLLIGFSEPFISLWLGKDFSPYYQWFNYKLVTIPFYASAGVFAFVYRSWNQVKLPALATLAIGVVNMAVVYILCNMSKGEEQYIIYILIFTSIATFVQTYVLGIFMLKRIYKDIRLKNYLLNTFKVIISMIGIVSLSYLLRAGFAIDNWFELVCSVLLVGLVSVGLLFFVILSNQHRTMLIGMIKRK